MKIESKKYGLLDSVWIPFRITPVNTLLLLGNQVLLGLVPAFQVMAVGSFVDCAISIFKGQAQVSDIYSPLAMMLLIIAYINIYQVLTNLVLTRFNIRLDESFRVAVVEKRARLEYRHIENNETWELINRTCGNPVGKLVEGFNLVCDIGRMTINIGSLLVIISQSVWWVSFLIILVAAPLFWVALKAGKTDYEAFKDAAKYERKAGYMKGILTGRDQVEERTLFGYTAKMNENWYEAFESARQIKMKVSAINFVRMKASGLLTVAISILIIGILVFPLQSGKLSLGIFTGLMMAAFNLVQMMSWQLSWLTRTLAQYQEYLKDLSLFSQLTEREGAVDLPSQLKDFEFKTLEFRKVNFKYPETERYILKDFSLTLHPKTSYAIVGVNGAGKTTFTKLLTGMYDNYEGEILINGKDLRNHTLSELKAIFSVVYQDFAKYQISVEDNIYLGSVLNHTEEKMLKALKDIELFEKVKELPQGIKTYLGKIKEGGVDLSGGQWQRLAIARTLVSEAPIIILDEPTAALDPVAESNVYEMFNHISQGKSSISITHRLGAGKLADQIIVLNEGQVVEQGNHEQLMQLKGLYADMFESQRSWYQ